MLPDLKEGRVLVEILEDQFTWNGGRINPDAASIIYSGIGTYCRAFDKLCQLPIPALTAISGYANRHFRDRNTDKIKAFEGVPLYPFAEPFLELERRYASSKAGPLAGYYLSLVGLGGVEANGSRGFANSDPSFEEICIADLLFTRGQRMFASHLEDWFEVQQKIHKIPELPADNPKNDVLAELSKQRQKMRTEIRSGLVTASWSWEMFSSRVVQNEWEQAVAEAAMYDYNRQTHLSD